jgi:hypothetical protein
MAEIKQKLWSREELLDLLDDEDIEALWDKWGLPATERKSRGVVKKGGRIGVARAATKASRLASTWSGRARTSFRERFPKVVFWKPFRPQLRERANTRRSAPEFMAAVGARSKTSLLQDVLRLRTPTLRMLRDVLTFLVDQNAAARTTGSQVVLEDEFDIAPQQVNAALLWSASVVRRHAAATWDDLSRRFDEEIVPLFRKIARYGEVEVFRRLDDPRDAKDPRHVIIRIERRGFYDGRTVVVD